MQDALTWGSLVGSVGALLAVCTFWLNRRAEAEARGKAEGEVKQRAESAMSMATAAVTKSEMTAALLAEARIEFAQNYPSHANLAAVEARFVGAIGEVRAELRGMNERLDRIYGTK